HLPDRTYELDAAFEDDRRVALEGGEVDAALQDVVGVRRRIGTDAADAGLWLPGRAAVPVRLLAPRAHTRGPCRESVAQQHAGATRPGAGQRLGAGEHGHTAGPFVVCVSGDRVHGRTTEWRTGPELRQAAGTRRPRPLWERAVRKNGRADRCCPAARRVR